MENLLDKIYPGKVLLFGEYTAIHGGETLAIPLYSKFANWEYDELEFESRNSIDKFIDFIVLQGMCEFDLERFSLEWEKGLYIDSNIPGGYGVGSSGSVVAAIYDGFVKNPMSGLNQLREIFQKMENYFHGTSSGIDPLVSYLGKSIHIKGETLKVLELDENVLLENLYLYDSGKSRKTGPLVQWYKDKLLSISYKKQIENVLSPLNAQLIDSFLSEDKESFSSSFEELSQFQKKHFSKMFPPEFKQSFKSLNGKYNASIKLCGAGGGGYFLVYCENKNIQEVKGIISLV